MLRSPIICLLLSSCLLLVCCTPLHKKMQATGISAIGLQQFKPAFNVALYATQVDVVGNHLSGLLIIKKMPDSSTRMVFSNEMGFTFFDFEFSANGNFKVYSIIKKMNKRSVLKTLRKDFELVMMQPMNYAEAKVYKNNELLYHVFPQSKGFNYYVTDSTGNKLIRMERASNKKVVVEAIMENFIQGIPDTIGISHKTFNFTIGLKRIER